MKNFLLILFLLSIGSVSVNASSTPKKPEKIYDAYRIDIEAEGYISHETASSVCHQALKKYMMSRGADTEGRWTGNWKNEGGKGLCGVRVIDKGRWKETPLNSKAVPNPKDICVRDHKIDNGWIYEDICRDKLVMDTKQLNNVTIIDKNNIPTTLKDGRYIFVLRKNQKGSLTLVLRLYDRNIIVNDNKECYFDQYGFKKNEETVAKGFSPHVRHTQLNGGWDPVWSAGEMLIENGAIFAISNDSGHFKPKGETLDYVVSAILYFHLPLAPNYQLLYVEKYDGINRLGDDRRCLGGYYYLPSFHFDKGL